MKPLSFCDHHRQRYAEKVPIPEAGEFLIGAYEDDGTTGGDGEFRVTLVELHGDWRWSFYPHLEVYGEGVPALRRAIDVGLLDALGPVNSRDEFASRLLAIGLGRPLRHPSAGGEVVSAYAKGDRVRFLGFGEPDPYSRLRVGSEGTVATVDDLGTVHVDWDGGGSLGMVVVPPPGRPPDRIELIAGSGENRPSPSE